MQTLALLAIAVVVLTACGGGTPATGGATSAPATAPTAGSVAPATSAPAQAAAPTAVPAGEQQVTITWGFWGSPEEQASHEKVAKAFMDSHPNIKVEIWHQDWNDYFTKLKTLWASGDPKEIPDVLFLWPTPSYAATGVLEDLTPYIQKSNYNLDDYWPNVLEVGQIPGQGLWLPARHRPGSAVLQQGDLRRGQGAPTRPISGPGTTSSTLPRS